jgi:hypothetical protein
MPNTFFSYLKEALYLLLNRNCSLKERKKAVKSQQADKRKDKIKKHVKKRREKAGKTSKK